MAHLIDGYNGVMPFRELTDARSLVSSAMREELKTGENSGLCASGAVARRDGGPHKWRCHRASGRRCGSRLGWRNAFRSKPLHPASSNSSPEWQSGRATGANAAAKWQTATVGPTSGRPAPRTGGRAGRTGVDARDQGVQGPTFDPAAAERLRDATRATRERATTFGADPLKGILRREQQGGPYVMRDAMVPERCSGPARPGAGLGALCRCGRRERALPVISDYAASSLRRSAMDADGMIDPARFDTWRRRHSEALRAVPGLERRFSDAARAAQEVADATALRVVRPSMGGATGRFGRLIGAEDAGYPQGGRLHAVIGGRDQAPDGGGARPSGGLDGMRRAVVDYMTSKLISNTEGATTGRGLIKSDQFQTFCAPA